MEITQDFRSPVTVGRERETKAITDAVHGAARGRGTFVVLAGEAGSGKTRLLRDAVEGAGDMALLSGAAPQVGPSAAFAVIAQALRSWTRTNPVPSGELAPFAPGLRHVLPEWPSSRREPSLSEDQLHLLILEGVLRLIIGVARRTGALVFLDDVHSADGETLDVLRHLAASIATEPVAVIVGLRTPEGMGFLEEARALALRDHAVVFDLAPLPERDIGEMCAAILGASPPADLIADIAARTDGVPLLVEQALEAHVRAGSVHRHSDRLVWAASTSPPVALTTREFVRRKLAGLSAESQHVIASAAVLGRLDADLCDGDVVTALEDGVRVGLLEAGSGEFRHALIREAVVIDLTDTKRVRCHQGCAEAIERVHPADPMWLNALAHHREACGDTEAAARLLVAAGARDLAAHAPVAAHAAHARAVALAPDVQTTVLARDALAGTLTALGRWDEALAVDMSLPAGPDRLARMARNAAQAGRLDDAEGYLARARESGTSPAPLQALGALVALWRGDLGAAIKRADEALALASDDAPSACVALDVRGRAARDLGRPDEARTSFEDGAARAREAGLTAQRLQAVMELGNLDFMVGGPDGGLRAARALAKDSSVFTTLVFADLSLVWWLGHRARLSEAAEVAEEAVDICRRFGLDALPHALVARGWVANLASWEAGEDMLAEAMRIAPNDHDVTILVSWSRGDCCLRSGAYAEAARRYEPGLSVIKQHPSAVGPPLPFMHAIALIACGDPAAALVLEAAARSNALPKLYVNRPWLAFAQALAAGAGIDDALAPFDSFGAFNKAVALVVASDVLAPSSEWLRTALDVFVEAGADDDASRARRLLRTTGAPVPRRRSVADLPDELRARGITRREAEVLRLVADGMSNAEVADRLSLSVRTVEGSISSLRRKLGVTSRGALIAAGLRWELARRPIR